MIRSIIFDFGNVIYAFDNNIFINNISNFTSKSEEDLKNLIYDSGLAKKYASGFISSNGFFHTVKERCDLSISKEEFIDAFTSIFTPIESTLELIKRLKKYYKIGLLSNTNELHFEYVIKPAKIFELFDVVTLSFEVKELKPSPKIFFDILDKLNLKPKECIYIDDIEQYSDVASELEINSINYTCYKELIEKLEKLGIDIHIPKK